MKDKYFWIKVGPLVWFFLLALEPVLEATKFYMLLMTLLILVGVVALVTLLSNVFQGKITANSKLFIRGKWLVWNLLVVLTGIIISYVYHSDMLKFWLFILVCDVFGYAMKWKPKPKDN